MSKTRKQGEGTLRKRADGRWEARVVVGYDEKGLPITKNAVSYTHLLRVYKVPEAEQAKVLAFIQSLDIKAIATEVMYKLFAMLEMKYDFKLSMDGETEETT